MTLKLCPFCGTMPFMDCGFLGEEDRDVFWVECGSCKAIGPEAEDRGKAEDLWNTRLNYQEDTDAVG